MSEDQTNPSDVTGGPGPTTDIYEITPYCDNAGRQITKMTDIKTKEVRFQTQVGVQTPDGGVMPVPFGIEAANIEEAFGKFDACAQEAVQAAAMKAAQEETSRMQADDSAPSFGG